MSKTVKINVDGASLDATKATVQAGSESYEVYIVAPKKSSNYAKQPAAKPEEVVVANQNPVEAVVNEFANPVVKPPADTSGAASGQPAVAIEPESEVLPQQQGGKRRRHRTLRKKHLKLRRTHRKH